MWSTDSWRIKLRWVVPPILDNLFDLFDPYLTGIAAFVTSLQAVIIPEYLKLLIIELFGLLPVLCHAWAAHLLSLHLLMLRDGLLQLLF